MRSILSLLLIGCIAATEFKKAFIPNGVIFVHHNDVFLTQQYKQIKFSLDFDDYFQEVDILKNRTNHITDICSKLDNPATCFQFTEFLNRITREMTNEHEQFKHHKNNQNNQTISTFLSNMNNYINSSLSNLNTKALTIDADEHIDMEMPIRFAEMLSGLNMRLVDTFSRVFLDEVIQLITLSFFEYSKLTDEILNTLENNNNLNIMHLLGLNNILDGISKLDEYLIESEKFIPFSGEKLNPTELLKISKTSIELSSQQITVHLNVPLTKKSQPLLKIFPVPIKMRGGEVGIIKNEKRYITYDNESYTTFNRPEINSCNALLNGKVICETSTARSSKDCLGEILLYNSSKLCEFVKIKTQNYLIRIDERTFYSVNFNPIEIEVFYKNGSHKKINMYNNGWLTVGENVSMTMKDDTWELNPSNTSMLADEYEDQYERLIYNLDEMQSVANIGLEFLLTTEIFWFAVFTIFTVLILFCGTIHCIWSYVCCR